MYINRKEEKKKRKKDRRDFLIVYVHKLKMKK